MSDKQATIYIVDVGATMKDCHNGRIETDLDFAMRYVWDKITTTMAASRKTWQLGVIGLRTDDTNVPLDDDDGYEHISVLKDLGPMEMSHLRSLQRSLNNEEIDKNEGGDATSAIALAVDMINKGTTNAKGVPLKFERRIILVTDGRGEIDGDEAYLSGLSKQINEANITLVVVGVDFDDPDYGYKEEDKDTKKADNEALLKSLADECYGSVFGTMAEAVEDLAVPRLKSTRPYSTFKGKLTLGNPEKYELTAVSIDVERYFRTKSAKPPSASSYVTRSDTGASVQSSNTIGDTDMHDTTAPGGDLSSVKTSYAYKVKDETSTLGWKHVDRDDLEKGYEYGSTAVHIAASDENVTKLETFQSFSIIGFIPWEKYERYLNMGESCVTIAQQTNDRAQLALSSLIHALFETESYAVARIVAKDGKDPIIVLLAPSIEPHLECLIDVPLPFAEDIRPYRFPPLDRVITTTGAVLDKHRNLPSHDLKEAMSKYVDAMDLSTLGRNDDNEPIEYMTIEETYSPLIHRMDQAIRRRAVTSDETVGPPADILLKWAQPPEELVSASSSQLEALVEAADVKRVPPKTKGKRKGRDTITPLSGLDIESLLNSQKRLKISAENAIPEFKQMLDNSETEETIENAADQMGVIIRGLVSKSTGNTEYDRAIENMKVMRDESIKYDLVEKYNDFLRDLKSKVAKAELNGDRREFWFQAVKQNRLGLIDDETIPTSTVSPQEAREFFSIKSELPDRSKPA
ncbi:ATP-dependent DNA helicase II subunit 2 [Coleophoma cylindrospora]|uniref:ATP-dependent DNA helicase II subunit 2 n=1 Tax=Coleophoma cylindrospora TaxID=1849047 RepID=A0A3D8RAZ9_9HELO|nr:ATP-dependent DNA helicase II subunit 2 [Coleophoma cylindrospora]